MKRTLLFLTRCHGGAISILNLTKDWRHNPNSSISNSPLGSSSEALLALTDRSAPSSASSFASSLSFEEDSTALTVKRRRRGLVVVGGGGAWRKQQERWDGFEIEERRREEEMFVRECWCSEWRTRGGGLERSIFAISRARTREVSLQLVTWAVEWIRYLLTWSTGECRSYMMRSKFCITSCAELYRICD